MDKTLAADAVLLSSAATPARADVVPGPWLMLSAVASLLLTLLAVVYLARISF